MKKIFQLSIAAFAMVVLTFVSCKKDVQNDKTNISIVQPSSIQIKNGRLIFTDKNDLKSKLDSLIKINDSELDFWESTVNFKSNRKYVSDAILENYNRFLKGDSITPDKVYNRSLNPNLDYVLNLKRELQIKDTVYYCKDSSIYAIPYENETKLQNIEYQINNSFEKSSAINVKKYDTKRIALKAGSNLKSNTIITGQQAQYEHPWTSGPFQYKFVFEAVFFNDTPVLDGYVQIHNILYYHQNSWKFAGEVISKYYQQLSYQVYDINGYSMYQSPNNLQGTPSTTNTLFSTTFNQSMCRDNGLFNITLPIPKASYYIEIKAIILAETIGFATDDNFIAWKMWPDPNNANSLWSGYLIP